MTEPIRKPKGFAAMTPERRSQISALGGAAVKHENRTYVKYPDVASKAGQKSKRPKGKIHG